MPATPSNDLRADVNLTPPDAGDVRSVGLGVAIGAAPAAIALGYALQIKGGTYDPAAMFWLTVALVCAVVALFLPRVSGPRASLAITTILRIGLIVQLTELATRAPGIYLTIQTWEALRPFLACVMVIGVLAAAGLTGGRTKGWTARLRVPVVLAAFFVAGAWIINKSPNPHIDTYPVHQDSAAALRRGINPYTITFADIYEGKSPYFQPGVSVGGRLQFGYPYLPTTLLLALPGHLFTGEHRFSQLACITAAAGFMAYARPHAIGAVAAGLFLLTPRSFQVIEDAWTEPFLAFLLAATVFCALRARGALPYVLGVFLASKQYAPFFAPVALLLVPRPWGFRTVWPMAWRAAVAALVVNVPFLLWDVDAFLHSTLKYQLTAPFRPDSLSYLAMWARSSGSAPPTALGFVAMGIATALVLWRAPRTPAGFALGIALVCGAFFAFGKQAFLNNYYLVVAALWCAVAVAGTNGDRTEVARPDSASGPGLQLS